MCKVWICAACIKTINTHLDRFQAMIDAGEGTFEIIKLPKCRVGKPPRDAAISETLRSHSPCALTAKEAELVAEYAWMERREQRDQER